MKEYGEVDFYRNDIIKYYDLDKIFRDQLNSLDTLDPFTRKHSENVGNLTCRLCEKLKLEKGFTIYTSICGFIHDIGKMFIDPKILQKEGKLTDEEFEIMKILISSKNMLVSKDILISKVWGDDSEAEDNNVEAYISFLRKKLAFIGSGVTISTTRKVGYKLEDFNA